MLMSVKDSQTVSRSVKTALVHMSAPALTAILFNLMESLVLVCIQLYDICLLELNHVFFFFLASVSCGTKVCSQMCAVVSDQPVCSCNVGYVLDDDNITCSGMCSLFYQTNSIVQTCLL